MSVDECMCVCVCVRFRGDAAKFLAITLPSIPSCGPVFAQTNDYSFVIWLNCGNKKFSYLIKEVGGVCARGWEGRRQEALHSAVWEEWPLFFLFS